MDFQSFVYIDATSAVEIEASIVNGSAWISPQTFEQITDWDLKPEGFCHGDVCIPAGGAVADDGSVDFTAYAMLSGRPLVVDEAVRALSLGVSSAARSEDLTSLEAPDFALPDLNGVVHRLSDYRGKKILLAAYASW